MRGSWWHGNQRSEHELISALAAPRLPGRPHPPTPTSQGPNIPLPLPPPKTPIRHALALHPSRAPSPHPHITPSFPSSSPRGRDRGLTCNLWTPERETLQIKFTDQRFSHPRSWGWPPSLSQPTRSLGQEAGPSCLEHGPGSDGGRGRGIRPGQPRALIHLPDCCHPLRRVHNYRPKEDTVCSEA
ncbi:unnamed protein product [Coregonus sp. 'balchen']|nr:unnamed protein product [Coregonus sp. 'balchen']